MSGHDERETVQLDPRTITPSWPIVVASLEQLGHWSVLALRLGVLALINECVREMALPNAKAELVGKLQILVDALRHLPWEG